MEESITSTLTDEVSASDEREMKMTGKNKNGCCPNSSKMQKMDNFCPNSSKKPKNGTHVFFPNRGNNNLNFCLR